MIEKKYIDTYGMRNTSPKMPIEKKYVVAFLDSLLNSTSVEIMYDQLKRYVWNEEYFIGLLSYHKDCNLFNDVSKPYRELIAYSMLRKNVELFQFVSQAFFTGKFAYYQESGKSDKIVNYTDDLDSAESSVYYYREKSTEPTTDKYIPVSGQPYPVGNPSYTATKTTEGIIPKWVENPYGNYQTDEYNLSTDMSAGRIRLSFKNYYWNNDLITGSVEGIKGEFANIQTRSEIEESLKIFYKFITIVKPARLGLETINTPACVIWTKKEGNNIVFDSGNYGGMKDLSVVPGGNLNGIVSNPTNVVFKINNLKVELDENEPEIISSSNATRLIYDVAYKPSLLTDKTIDATFTYNNNTTINFKIPDVIYGIGNPFVFRFILTVRK